MVLGKVLGGLGVVLVRFSCRLVGWNRFFGRLGLVLESFWGAPGVVFSASWNVFVQVCGALSLHGMLACHAIIGDR